MKLLLFEWLTGGGHWEDRSKPDFACSLQRQGREMLASIAEDFHAAGVNVVVPIDQRLSQWSSPLPGGVKVIPMGSTNPLMNQLVDVCQDVDYVMLVAPESGSRLLTCAKWMDQEKLISPNAEFIELTSCKTSTIEHLQGKGFQAVTPGMQLSRFLEESGRDRLRLPAVLKPNDGAGSEDVRWVADWSELDTPRSRAASQYRIESFVSGTPVSVSIICGDTSQILAPTRQVFDGEPFGEYVGAEFPLPPEISERAIRLAMDAIKALPATIGYIGFDMVISDTAAELDCLIEVNPRLTMSYLKLRTLYRENLAQVILDAANSTADSRARTSLNSHCIFRAPNP